MAAVTRLGLYGGPRGLYGDFSTKEAFVVADLVNVITITSRDRRIKSSVRDRIINILARDRREIGKE